MFIISETQRTFASFFIFGLLNNILYVIILSAAIDLVGPSTPKAIVLLADIIPSFSFKVAAPFHSCCTLYYTIMDISGIVSHRDGINFIESHQCH